MAKRVTYPSDSAMRRAIDRAYGAGRADRIKSESHLKRIYSGATRGLSSKGARGHARTAEHPYRFIKGAKTGRRRHVKPQWKTNDGRLSSLALALPHVKGPDVHLIAHGVVEWDPMAPQSDPYRRGAKRMTDEERAELEEDEEDEEDEEEGRELWKDNVSSSVRPLWQLEDQLNAYRAAKLDTPEGRADFANVNCPVNGGRWVHIDWWSVAEAAPRGTMGPRS